MSSEVEYWLSRTPQERLQALECLRRLYYGYDPATARVQRVLDVTDFSERCAEPYDDPLTCRPDVIVAACSKEKR
jgi:hypothetical protein